ncbi:TRAP transporter small permease [uncultured Dysosmobacter sp.]|uniref:TRAP transporter small permease n=1 Tax=uncultured Dysosmobacter sp. TaxID=2591384 RepID=UPI00262B34B8|nr:TRAP transporter small permease [uncultured Dysosmobacter sp.]
MKKCRDVLSILTNGIDKIERWIITVIFAETIIVGFMQVVCRFILKASLPWSEELLRFSFVWLTYIAASMGIMRGTHTDVRVVVDRLPVPVQKALNIFREVATLVFCGIVFWFSLEIITLQISKNQISPAMHIPMYIPYLGLTCSFGIMVVQCIARLLASIEEAFNKKDIEVNL